MQANGSHTNAKLKRIVVHASGVPTVLDGEDIASVQVNGTAAGWAVAVMMKDGGRRDFIGCAVEIESVPSTIAIPRQVQITG